MERPDHDNQTCPQDMPTSLGDRLNKFYKNREAKEAYFAIGYLYGLIERELEGEIKEKGQDRLEFLSQVVDNNT